MKTKSILIQLLVLFTISSAFATNQIITFANYSYSPANGAIKVGDTVTWQGDFAAHPLSTTAIPSGAMAIIHINIGTSYMYVVSVPGSYSYQCDSHFGLGMTGSFTVNPISGVEDVTAKPTLQFKLSNWGGLVMLTDQTETISNSYRVRVANILGEVVYEGDMQCREQGKLIDLQQSPQGLYLLNITDKNRQTYVRRFMLE